MKRLLLAAAFCAGATPALALFDTAAPGLVQIVDPAAPTAPLGTVAHPLNTTGTFTGTIGGFPGGTGGVIGTPVSAQTTVAAGSTQTLPAGTSVIASNAGSNMAFCQLGATASVNSQPIPPGGGWFDFTVGSATQITCVTAASTTTVNTFGGGGIATGTGGGGGGGGGTVTIGAPLGTQAIGASVAVTPATSSVFPVTGTFWQTTQPVSGTFFQATQPVSAAALPLPTGAATSALQTTINTTLGTPMQNSGGSVTANLGTIGGAATAANQEVTAAGTTATSAQAVQFVTGGVPFNVTQAAASVLAGAYSSGSFVAGALADGAIATIGTQADTAWVSGSGTAIAILKKIASNGSGGGLSVTDGATFTASTSAFTPGGCEYNSSPTTLASGAQGTFACTTNRALLMDVATSSTLYGALSAGSGTPGSAVPAQGVMVGGTDGTNFRTVGVDANNNVNTATADNATPTACSGTITTGNTAQVAIAASSTLHGFTIANIDPSAGSGEPLWISFTTTAAASGTNSWPLPPPASTTFAGMGSYTTPVGFGSNHAVSIVGATTGHKFSCTTW